MFWILRYELLVPNFHCDVAQSAVQHEGFQEFKPESDVKTDICIYIVYPASISSTMGWYWGSGFSCGVVARSHLARTPGGKVSFFSSFRCNAPHCRLRSACVNWLAQVKFWMASLCSWFKTFTLLTRPLSFCVIPSTLTDEKFLRRPPVDLEAFPGFIIKAK